MGRFGVGQAMRRVEDQRFLTGTGRYTDDISLAGQAVAVVVRSPHAHARISGIDAADARALPGVLGVFTIADLDADGIGSIPCDFAVRNRDGSAMPLPARPVLARGKVRHVGEAVAFVIAETLTAARDAAELVAVDYDPLEAVVDLRAALNPGAPELYDEVPGNLLFDWELGDAAAVDRAFAGAARVVGLDLVNNRLAPTPLEPRSAIGAYDAASGRYTLTTGSQGSHTLRQWLARDVLHIPEQNLRVISPDVGGGFGMRLFLYPEHVLVTWAARRLGRPVRWLAERSESFLSDSHGRDHRSHAELALDNVGRFLALRVSTLANVGAALSQYAVFVPTVSGSGMLTGVYTIPALHVRVRGVMTTTAPVDAYRGAGRPEASYLIERLVDKAARELGLAPDDLRRRNFIPPSAMPYRTAGGKTYDSGDFARTLDDAERLSGWQDFAARRAASEKRGRMRGRGLAYYVETCAGGESETAEVRMSPDGTLTIHIGTQSTGQGHETAFVQMAADALGLAAQAVRVVQGDTDVVAVGAGTGGSRTLTVGGSALAAAVDDLIASGKRIAARALGLAEADVGFTGGVFHGSGSGSLALTEVAGLGPLEGRATWKPQSGTYPNGCHICEVEIDPETGVVTLVDYSIVDDVGVVLNPLLLEGQIIGGAAQGIGQALLEKVVYDPDSGQLLTGTLVDYAMPRADAMPPFRFDTNEVPCRRNPLGVKGAGEAGTIGATPTVINAVVDALAPLGIDHIDMPATPLRVWQAMQAARRGVPTS
ncbi:MAG: xanthine dehydrogenase family protein molybdopterin-binding subunit [Alphaproteobacteria bacterium]